MKRKRIAIVGAGMGGLAAAIDLARAGHQVTVIEARDAPGGKMREIQVDGAPIDSGPTVLTMRWVFENLFRDAGAQLRERVELHPSEILARHSWGENQWLDLYADPKKSFAAIAEFAGPKAADGYESFRLRAREIYQTLEDSFIRATLPTPIGLVRNSGGLSSLLKINPFETMWKELSRHFDDPRLRQLFGRYATYCGSSPFEAPATLLLVAHVELDGVWTVAGGMQRLAEAMAKLATELGATIHYSSPVSRIARRRREFIVRRDDGEASEFDAVVMNTSPTALAAGLFGPELKTAVAPIAPASRSLSALTLSFRGHSHGRPLSRHNVFFSRDYPREFRELFQEHRLPSEPTVYLCSQDHPSGEPPTTARRFFAIVNGPPIGDRHSFSDSELHECKTQTFAALERCGVTIEPQTLVTTSPNDFNTTFPGDGGAIYGMATHGSRASFKRPSSRTKIRGVYLAGGATHPGAGVPNSTQSGRLAAAAVLEDFGSTWTWSPGATRGGISTR